MEKEYNKKLSDVFSEEELNMIFDSLVKKHAESLTKNCIIHSICFLILLIIEIIMINGPMSLLLMILIDLVGYYSILRVVRKKEWDKIYIMLSNIYDLRKYENYSIDQIIDFCKE